MRRSGGLDSVRSVRPAGGWLLAPPGLQLHATLFAAAAVVLILCDVALGPERLWVWRPLLLWGIVLATHAALVVERRIRPRRSGQVGIVVAATDAAGLAAEPPRSTLTPDGVAGSARPAPAAPAGGPDAFDAPPIAAEDVVARQAASASWLTSWPTSSDAAGHRLEPEIVPEAILALWGSPGGRPAVDAAALVPTPLVAPAIDRAEVVPAAPDPPAAAPARAPLPHPAAESLELGWA